MKEFLTEEQQEQLFNRLLALPANLRCADCHGKSPRWVSLNFGVFICYYCAGQHRNLGMQLTRVRSIKLDKWTTDLANIMEKIGNKVANDYYEANLPASVVRPTTGEKVDETQLKHWVVTKYVKKKWAREGEEPYQKLMAGTFDEEDTANVPASKASKQPSNAKAADLVDLLDLGAGGDQPAPQKKTVQQPSVEDDLLNFDNFMTAPAVQKHTSNPSNSLLSTPLALHHTNSETISNAKHKSPVDDFLDFDAPQTAPVAHGQPATTTLTQTMTTTTTLITTTTLTTTKASTGGNFMDMYSKEAPMGMNGIHQPQPVAPNDPTKKGLMKGNYAYLDSLGKQQHAMHAGAGAHGMPSHFTPAFHQPPKQLIPGINHNIQPFQHGGAQKPQPGPFDMFHLPVHGK